MRNEVCYTCIYINKDCDSCYGVSFPDFDGCFSAADELVDVPVMAQESLELHFDGDISFKT